MKILLSDLLEIAYLDDGPAHAPVALLLHGSPDDVYGMTPVAERLRTRGFRTIVPWLRGSVRLASVRPPQSAMVVLWRLRKTPSIYWTGWVSSAVLL